MASEDESHDLVLCEDSAMECFPSISPDTILKQCRRIKDMKRDGADLEEIFHELDVHRVSDIRSTVLSC